MIKKNNRDIIGIIYSIILGFKTQKSSLELGPFTYYNNTILSNIL
jgi:hypothetical protein